MNSKWVQSIRQYLRDEGVTELPPLSEFGIQDNDWETAQIPVPVDGVRRLHHWAVEATGNALFSVELGLRLQPFDMRALGILLWGGCQYPAKS